jgi:hypothetical protein
MPVVQAQIFAKAWLSLLNKTADLDSDALKCSLHTTTYTPSINADQFVSDLAGELSTASGYTSGGATVTGSFALTVANSWASQWAASTAFTVGQVRRPTTGNGFLYRVAVAGTSSGSAPTFPTVVGTTVADGGVTWVCIGTAIVVLDLTDATLWSSFSAGPYRYAVVSDRTPGTAATQPLICLFDFGSNQTGGGGNFDLSTPVEGILTIPVG